MGEPDGLPSMGSHRSRMKRLSSSSSSLGKQTPLLENPENHLSTALLPHHHLEPGSFYKKMVRQFHCLETQTEPQDFKLPTADPKLPTAEFPPARHRGGHSIGVPGPHVILGCRLLLAHPLLRVGPGSPGGPGGSGDMH